MSAGVALVFGGSRGIGAAIALRLAKDGFDVALTYVSQPDQAGDIVSAIENVGRHAVAIKADSADPSAIRTAVAEAVQQLGTLDVAVVNAGVLRLASVEAFTLEETEVARLVAYLARPEAGFVTGSAITINGGCLAKLSYERDFNVNTSYDDIIKDFLTCFEAKDADRLASFLHPDVVFLNYGDPEVRGKNAVRETWSRLFSNFGALRFETVHQAVNGNIVIAEQIHNIALPAGKLTPIMNMAIYEIVDGKIAAWRDYTNSSHAKKLLGI